MSDPIISPWLIYALSVLGNLQLLFLLTGAILTVGILIYTVVSIIEEVDFYKFKHTLSGACVAIVLFFLGCIIPSQKYMLAIIATNYLTHENVAKIIDGGGNLKESIKGDVIEIINAINEKEP